MKGNTNRMFWIALAAALPLAGLGCTLDIDDDPATSDEQQASTGFEPQCRVNQPIGWSVGRYSCVGRLHAYSLLNPGQQATYISTSIIGKGQGYVTVLCDANGDGFFHAIDTVCGPGGNL